HDPAATLDGTLPRRERGNLVPGPDRRGHRRVPAPAGPEIPAHGRDARTSPTAPQHVRGAGLHPADLLGLRMRPHRGMPARHRGEGGLTEIENLHLLCWQHHLDKTNGLLDPTRLPTTPTQPGRTRWSIGTSGDIVTVIDDLDTASIQIAEDLAQAWA